MTDHKPPPPPPTHKDPTPPPKTTPSPVTPDAGMSEQDKDKGHKGHVPGVGPASPAQPSPGPVETIEDLNIGPRDPYPTGNPPPPREEVTRSQGVKDNPVHDPVKPDRKP